MEASAQGAGAAGEQATREFPSVETAAGAAPADPPAPDAFAERPELFVGAAFAGGFVLAKIVKRFGR